MSFTIELPVPPSLNNAFFNRKQGGRVKTPAYTQWLKNAGWKLKAEIPAAARVAGPFRVAINLPFDMAGDIDNRVKGIIDLLVKCDRVDDDRNLEELVVRRRHKSSFAIVHVKAMRGL